MIKTITMLIFFFGMLIHSFSALACQDLIYPSRLTQATIDTYDVIAVVSVDELIPTLKNTRYGPPFKFSGKIIKSLKGPHKTGEKIYGETGDDHVGAACPILLAKNRSYLLFFRGFKNPVTLARYGTYYTEVGVGRFNVYVKDIEDLMKKKSKSMK